MSCERWFELMYTLITIGGASVVLLLIGIAIGKTLK
jgi:hypothetical protein